MDVGLPIRLLLIYGRISMLQQVFDSDENYNEQKKLLVALSY